jgi:transcriptional regulator with XRE-family HTH domain
MGDLKTYRGVLVGDDDQGRPVHQMPTRAAALLVEARLRSGYTQAELADLAHVSRSALSEIEHGRRDPGIGYFLRLLRAAGFDLVTTLEPTAEFLEARKGRGKFSLARLRASAERERRRGGQTGPATSRVP